VRYSTAVASTFLWQTVRRLNRGPLKTLGVQLVKPSIIHGPPAYIGVTEWSRRLWAAERVMRHAADVPGDFAECGVFYGYGILIMLHHVRDASVPRRIYGFDSFSGHPPQAIPDRSTTAAEVLKDYWRVTEADVWRTLELGTDTPLTDLQKTVTLVPGWFSETMPNFRGVLSYIHLDPDYYQSTKDALTYLWPQLSPGGIVLFGQLENPTLPGKGIALKEFLAATAADTVRMEHDTPSGHYFLRKLK
jgi:hypothetical protein